MREKDASNARKSRVIVIHWPFYAKKREKHARQGFITKKSLFINKDNLKIRLLGSGDFALLLFLLYIVYKYNKCHRNTLSTTKRP